MAVLQLALGQLARTLSSSLSEPLPVEEDGPCALHRCGCAGDRDIWHRAKRRNSTSHCRCGGAARV